MIFWMILRGSELIKNKVMVEKGDVQSFEYFKPVFLIVAANEIA